MEEGSPLRLDEKRQNASPFRPSSLIPRPSPSAFQPSYFLISCSPPLLVVVKRKSRYRGPVKFFEEKSEADLTGDLYALLMTPAILQAQNRT